MTMKKPKSSPNAKKHHSISNKSITTKKKKTHSGKNPNFLPLGHNPLLLEMKKKQEEEKMSKIKNKKNKKCENEKLKESSSVANSSLLISTCSKEKQLKFFLHFFRTWFKLTSLELEGFKDTCMVELSPSIEQGVENISEHMKATFKHSWKDELCDEKLIEGKIDAGSPAILVISTSALRSLELLRGLRSLTKECRPAKLFAKHLKVEEQVLLLKDRVNIACGTPSRIKKLIDMDALLLSRLQIVVLDMQKDAKGYSLFNLPQVSKEFWELYKDHFNERLLQGHARICIYGSVSQSEMSKVCDSNE